MKYGFPQARNAGKLKSVHALLQNSDHFLVNALAPSVKQAVNFRNTTITNGGQLVCIFSEGERTVCEIFHKYACVIFPLVLKFHVFLPFTH